MYVKQLSVFLENREGRLEKILEILKNNDINIISLSLADTTDYGLLRMIVSNPDAAKKALSENDCTAMLSDVIAIKISHKVGQLQELLAEVCKARINVEYMYALSTNDEDASIVMKTSDTEKASKLIEAEGVDIITQEELEKM